MNYPDAGNSIDVLGTETFRALVNTLKISVAALREADVPFLLGGSFAAWARGGPEPQNDLDLMIKPPDAERALAVLERVGMRPERPPEEWLFKAWHGEVMIDLIFHPAGLDLTDAVFERADEIPVLAVQTPVMALDDVLTTKLHALDEHSLDYSQLLGIARALREQVDWRVIRARAGDSPYARAFFTLVQELGIAPAPTASGFAPPRRVRVVSGSER
jgi:Uncharacterised nucleotidyltransferase